MDFFKQCKSGLMPGGLICVKENVTKGGVDLDAQDSSVTRYHKRVVAKKLGFRLKFNKRLLLSFLFTKQWTPEKERGHARFTSAQRIFFFNFSHLLLSLMLRLIRHIFQSFQLDEGLEMCILRSGHCVLQSDQKSSRQLPLFH